ncbi:MAG: mechanosensitive ion channel [Gammaproteobacteria bacterium]|nr:mechanosensitive ion channel [Gammaproteobacteria bacterium]MCP5424465.1 mechanosensitive ion channel [Gammaproteobacteria bacterium]MCP5458459.1 mechanosensitive ion channel [Gammaproteobacteria bacterium]
MDESSISRLFQNLGELQVLQILVVIVLAWLSIMAIDRLIPWLSNRLSGRSRLYLMPSLPALRLLVVVLAAGFLLPLLIKPTLQNFVAILGVIGVAIGFAFKDYVSSVIAGVLSIYERPYRPGDWVKIDDAYGEVRSVSLRALRIVTPDDTVVTIPHSKIWDTAVYNDTDGQRYLQCVAEFFLEPEHDAKEVRQVLHDVALTSPYVHIFHPIAVIVAEQPGYTRYRLKAYPIDSRDQFLFISDMTVRGKAALSRLGVRPARFIVH